MQKIILFFALICFSFYVLTGDNKLSDSHIADEHLHKSLKLVVFESETCGACKSFKKDVSNDWKSNITLQNTFDFASTQDQELLKEVWATPTIVMFKDGREVSRYTGYDGNQHAFWKWFGMEILTPEQKKIAFESGTEMAFTGSLLDNDATGYYVDPITGDKLFRSDTKFTSGTGWPSFFDPMPGALTFKDDGRRIEVLSASSGIHLGHVFNDGPPPSGKRYCINSAVLKFVADESI